MIVWSYGKVTQGMDCVIGDLAKRLERAAFRRFRSPQDCFRTNIILTARSKAPEYGALQTLREIRLRVSMRLGIASRCAAHFHEHAFCSI
jgi:hypothetical protein